MRDAPIEAPLQAADAEAALCCPCCVGAVHAQATACPHCGRDLALVMPLLREQRRQAQAVATLRGELDALRETVAAAPVVNTGVAAPKLAPGPAPGWMLLLALALSFVLLLGAHWLLVVRADVPTLALRLVSVVIPLTVAMLMPGLTRVAIGVQAAAGLLLGLGAALAMSAVVARIDGVPVMPQGNREMREFLEYAGSIALAHLAGALIARLQAIRATRRALERGGQARGEALQKLSELAGPAIAAAGAIYSGVRSVME